MTKKKQHIRTLAVDIGGSGIKTIVLDEAGEPLTERNRVPTPNPAQPEPVIQALELLNKENLIKYLWVFPEWCAME